MLYVPKLMGKGFFRLKLSDAKLLLNLSIDPCLMVSKLGMHNPRVHALNSSVDGCTTLCRHLGVFLGVTLDASYELFLRLVVNSWEG